MRRALLRVEAPNLVAAAIFAKGPSGWACIQAAPIIRWMERAGMARIREKLDSKGWPYRWITMDEKAP